MKQPLRLTLACSALALCLALGFTTPATAQSQEVSRRAFAAADLNQDGRINLDEFHKDVVQGWHALDLDGDGYVTREELKSLPDRKMAAFVLAALRGADKQRGGRLSFREVVEARMSFFDAADTDRDESLSLAEVLAYESQMRQRSRALRQKAAEPGHL